MTKVGELHIALAKKVLRYLQSRKHLNLTGVQARAVHHTSQAKFTAGVTLALPT